VVTNTYQLATKSFDQIEQFTSLIFVLLIFVIFRFKGRLQQKYELELEQKNEIIQEQSQELQIKQLDIEKIVANNNTQIKIKENLLLHLRKAIKSKDIQQEIKSIMLDLNGQINSQKRYPCYKKALKKSMQLL